MSTCPWASPPISTSSISNLETSPSYLLLTTPQIISVGLTGDIVINENGDREADYTLNDLDPETGVMRPVATYWGAKRLYEKIGDNYIHWPGGRENPPPDVPYCGFTGEARHCQVPEGFPIAATVSIVCTILILLGSTISFMVYRKLKLEAELADYWWKVKYEDIMFPEKIVGSKKSAVSLAFSESSFGMTGKSGSTKAPSVVNSLATAAANIQGVSVGMYRGIKVAVKSLNVKKLHVTRQLLMELKSVRQTTPSHGPIPCPTSICILIPNRYYSLSLRYPSFQFSC